MFSDFGSKGMGETILASKFFISNLWPLFSKIKTERKEKETTNNIIPRNASILRNSINIL